MTPRLVLVAAALATAWSLNDCARELERREAAVWDGRLQQLHNELGAVQDTLSCISNDLAQACLHPCVREGSP